MSKHLVRVDEELGVADNYIDREEDGSDLDLKRRYSRAPLAAGERRCSWAGVSAALWH